MIVTIGERKVELSRPFPSKTKPPGRNILIDAYFYAFRLAEHQHNTLNNPQASADFLFMRENHGTFKREQRRQDSYYAVIEADYYPVTVEGRQFFAPMSLKTGTPLYMGPIPAIYERATQEVQATQTSKAEARKKINELRLIRDLLIGHSIPVEQVLENTRPRGITDLRHMAAYAFGEHANFTPDPAGLESLADMHMREAVMRTNGPVAKFT